MPKKCKNCDTTVDDSVKVCPVCDNLAFDSTNKTELSDSQLQELAKAVSENLSKKKAVLWGITWRVGLLVFALLGIPGAITGWNIWDSFNKFQNSTTTNIESKYEKLYLNSSNQIEKAHSEITKDVTVKFQAFSEEASNQIFSAYSSATNLIASQFQEPRVKETVESAAKGEATIILEKEVKPVVEDFRSNVEEKVDSIVNEQNILELDAKVRANDYQAYLQLYHLSEQTNDVGKFSAREISEVDRSLEMERSDATYMILTTSMESQKYSGPFTSDELAEFLFDNSFSGVTAREGLANEIRNLNQPLFLGGFIDMLNKETDLLVANRLTQAISGLSNKDFYPKDLEKINLWWNASQLEYTNWPYSDFENGMNNFLKADYSDAAKSFDKVVKIDPAADMSRAIMIGCYWETGDTNQAILLAKEFKNPSGRWAQWALIKTKFETGDITNATIQLADFYTNNLTLPHGGFIGQGSHFWRQTDWSLFEQRTKFAQ